MTEIRVECRRWLGFGRNYVVLVDGEEVGRLGFQAKAVTSPVTPGTHRVAIRAVGRNTVPVEVNVAEQDLVVVDLVYPSWTAIFRSAPARGREAYRTGTTSRDAIGELVVRD